MLKRFFVSFMGSMAAIWASVLLLGILFFMTIGVAMSDLNTSAPVKISNKSILYLDLSGVIEERASTPALADIISGGEPETTGLNDITGAIRRAATDKRISGIYINCGGSSAGVATRQSIAEALRVFQQSGKWIISYADSYSQGDYYIASVADSLFINPQGSIDIHGLAATTIFYTGLLDKLGVEMQVLKVGTFKSAVEPFILKEMSAASRMQQEVYLNSIWGVLSEQIAENRHVDVADVNRWADNMIVTENAEYYITVRAADGLYYRHEVEKRLKELTDTKEKDDLPLVAVADYCKDVNILDPSYLPDIRQDKKKTIAILYATGDIVDNGDGNCIAASTMVPQILDLAENEDIAGLILRVNSGGGSAYASEQIWEALEQFKKKGKKFYVSMGDVAASGGYYISCGADRIYAQPTTLTGSIGIFGLIPCAKELLTDKLSLGFGTVQTNANGNFPSLAEPMSPSQQAKMQQMINRGYETFVGRCAEGRNMPVDSIKAIAEGRVWDGMAALRLHLVDDLKPLHDVISDMAADLDIKGYAIDEYPRIHKKWWEEALAMEGTIKERIVRSQLGDAYEFYNAIERVKTLEPMQCRMETVVIE